MWIESLENRAYLSQSATEDFKVFVYPGPEPTAFAGQKVPAIRVELRGPDSHLVSAEDGTIPFFLVENAGPGPQVGQAVLHGGAGFLRNLRLTAAGDQGIEPELAGIVGAWETVHIKPLKAVSMQIESVYTGGILITPSVRGEMVTIAFLDKFGNGALADRPFLKIKNPTPAGTIVNFYPVGSNEYPLPGLVRKNGHIIGIVGGNGNATVELTASGTAANVSVTIYCANLKMAPIITPSFPAWSAP